MSFPFIIWTCQRTGGISLFSALSSVSEHPAAENEPFDNDGPRKRQFTDVGRMLPVPGRDKRLREIVDGGWLIKHCYELFPDEFNHALAEISTRAGYRHIHLVRRDEMGRLISKGIAERYSTWVNGEWTQTRYSELIAANRQFALDVPALKRYQRVCEERWGAISPLLMAQHVATEDIFGDQQASVLVRLAGFLGFPHSSINAVAANLGCSHGTKRLYKLISNLSELKDGINR